MESNGYTLDAEKPLVHDLDLTVYGGGVRRLGNEQFWTEVDPTSEDPGAKLAKHDRDNNWEIVVVPQSALQAGDKYRIEVNAFFVRNDPAKPDFGQEYSVVVLGDVSSFYGGKDPLHCPACAVPKTKSCMVPPGCSGVTCTGRGKMECNERGQYSDCMHVACKEGYVTTGQVGKNACVKYSKIETVRMVVAQMKLIGDLTSFSAINFEIALGDQLQISNDRIMVTGSYSGSIIVRFQISAFFNTTMDRYDYDQLESMQSIISSWISGDAVAGYTLLENMGADVVDLTPIPPYCGDLNGLFLLYGWCDFEYYVIWNPDWGGGIIMSMVLCVVIFLAQQGVAALAKLLDKSLSPAEASIAIKLALSQNAAEVVRLTVDDKELMRTVRIDNLYSRIQQIFRIWAFGDETFSYDEWKSLKLVTKAFKMWADPTCVPGGLQDAKAWDIMMIGAGKVDLSVDIEMDDLRHGGLRGVHENQIAVEMEDEPWAEEDDALLREAMGYVTNNLSKNPRYTPPDMAFDQVVLNYFSDETYRNPGDVKIRWEILCEEDIEDAKIAKTASREAVASAKQNGDMLGAFGNVKAQRILKRVGAKLFNREVLKSLEQWKHNMDAAKGWGFSSGMGISLNPLAAANSV